MNTGKTGAKHNAFTKDSPECILMGVMKAHPEWDREHVVAETFALIKQKDKARDNALKAWCINAYRRLADKGASTRAATAEAIAEQTAAKLKELQEIADRKVKWILSTTFSCGKKLMFMTGAEVLIEANNFTEYTAMLQHIGRSLSPDSIVGGHFKESELENLLRAKAFA